MYQRILVPVDGSATSQQALAAALQLARDTGGRLRLVHALDELAYMTGFSYTGDLLRLARDQAGKLLQDALATAQAAGIPAETELLEAPGRRLGEVVAEAARAWPADLIVVGTHGRRGVSRVLLGSGAEQVLRLAPVPVLSIRGTEPA